MKTTSGLVLLIAVSLMLPSTSVLAKKDGGDGGMPGGAAMGQKKGWEDGSPKGWTQGEKKGWDGEKMPPGLFKKQEAAKVKKEKKEK